MVSSSNIVFASSQITIIGSGLGVRGVIDNGLIRDSHGRLFIPGTTLKGVIRDACEDIVDGLNIPRCNGTAAGQGLLCGVNRPGETCLLCLIFGTPAAEALFRFQAARRRDALHDLLGEEELAPVREAFTRVEAHNRIDRVTGTAQEDFLFSYELGKKSEPFSAKVVQIASFANATLMQRRKRMP